MNWLTLVVLPGAGIALLVLLARWLGFNAKLTLASAAAANTIAHDALVAFHAEQTALAADARAALVAARDGRIALVVPHGDRWIVRVANGAHVTRHDDMLTVALDEPMFAPVQLQLANDAAGWAARLEARP
ncbi:MAG: hypothetical protein ACRCUI_08510 [Polymorphobacter sp.]